MNSVFAPPAYSMKLKKDCPLQKPLSEFDKTWNAALRLLESRHYKVDQTEKRSNAPHSFIYGHHQHDPYNTVFVFVCEQEPVNAPFIEHLSNIMTENSVRKTIIVTKDEPLSLETKMSLLTHFITTQHEIEVIKRSRLWQLGTHSPVPSKYFCPACGKEGDHWIMECQHLTHIKIIRDVSHHLWCQKNEIYAHSNTVKFVKCVLMCILQQIHALSLHNAKCVLVSPVLVKVLAISQRVPNEAEDEQMDPP
eukprot:729390_1